MSELKNDKQNKTELVLKDEINNPQFMKIHNFLITTKLTSKLTSKLTYKANILP